MTPDALTRSLVLCLMAGLVACGGSSPPPVELSAPPALGPGEEEVLLSTLEPQIRSRVEAATIDLGTEEATRALGDGWLWPESLEDGTTFTWAAGEESVARMWLTSSRPVTLRARAWPYRDPEGSEKQRISLWVNGVEVDSWRLRPGLRDQEIRVPARVLRPGVNQLTLKPSLTREEEGQPPISAAFDLLEISPANQERAPFFEGSDLHLPPGSQIEVFHSARGRTRLVFDALEGGGDSRLRLEVASDREAASGAGTRIGVQGPGSFEVLGDAAREAAQGEGPGGSGDTDVVRLALIAELTDGDSPDLVLRSPRLVGAPSGTGAVAAAADGSLAPRFREKRGDSARRPNVILYLVDTLRADRLGCYGNPEPVSPAIDAFARQSILFERTTAQSSWTRASMASIFTGLSAGRHGVETRLDALPNEAITLAEMLSASGYATAGVLTNGNAGRSFGFAQGFDSFTLLGEEQRGVPAGVEAVHRAAEGLLEGPLAAEDKPFFLYLHTMEPHAPYVIPEPLPGALEKQALPDEVVAQLAERGVSTEGPKNFASVAWIQALFHGLLEANEETGRELGLAYNAAILHNDRYFGRLIRDLERRGLLEETVVVFLSDHGEELFDHGSWSHGLTLYEEQLLVPFIVRFPGDGAPRGLRSRQRARQVDLLPTLLDYLSLPAPPGLDGSSLLVRARSGENRPGFSQLDLDGRRLGVWIEGALKLICPEKGACSLYDLDTDPAEKRDLAAERPVTADALRLKLETWRARSRALEKSEAELDPEMERQLQALGYL
ncbi:MAG: sulfatase [Acidobacteriota bacterium]